MRIISGHKKGLAIQAVPGDSTRPTSDRVKESIYNIIGPYFDGEIVLDLFAGSGNLGIEALSRGAKRAVFIDKSGTAIQVMRKNLQHAQLIEQAEIYKADWKAALEKLAVKGMRFDIVFLDPPYLEFQKQIADIIVTLVDKQLLSDQAIIVYEYDSKYEKLELPEYFTGNHYKYGNTGVTVLVSRGVEE